MGIFNRKELTEIQDTVEIRIGEQPIPGWTIVRRLGEGGFGSVWCIERSTGNAKLREALKVIQIRDDERSRMMLQRELDTMLILREHPNIVRCDDFVFAKAKTDKWTGDALLIRMELLTPLDTHFDINPPDENEVIRMGTDILTALDQLYKKNMLHRDIKPANIFRNSFGVYKLGDYGLARTVSDDANLSACGTLVFMAPEILNGEEYDHTVDMYALALTMYLYLRGGDMYSLPVPFERMSPRWIPEQGNISSPVYKALKKALARNPKERFTNPKEFLDALRETEESPEIQLADIVPEESVPATRETKLQNTERAVKLHRSKLENSIRESVSSVDAFLNSRKS